MTQTQNPQKQKQADKPPRETSHDRLERQANTIMELRLALVEISKLTGCLEAKVLANNVLNRFWPPQRGK